MLRAVEMGENYWINYFAIYFALRSARVAPRKRMCQNLNEIYESLCVKAIVVLGLSKIQTS